MHAVISLTTKPDSSDEDSKQTRVVTFDVPASEILTQIPVVEELNALTAPAA